MMNLKEIFKHYADDLSEGADIRKEAIASIEQAAEHIDEYKLRHNGARRDGGDNKEQRRLPNGNDTGN